MIDSDEGEEDGATANSLYRHVLAINYYESIYKLDSLKDSDLDPPRPLQAVPSSFQSIQEYIDVFEPLMLTECTSLLRRGKVEAEEIPETNKCVMGPASQTDDFLMVQVLLEVANERIKTRDVILLTKDDPQVEGVEDWRWQQLNALGVVDSKISNKSMNLRFYLPKGKTLRATEKKRMQAMSNGLRTREAGFYLTPLANLSTILREWHALHSLRNVVFKDILLSGSAPKNGLAALMVPPAMEVALRLEYNDSQMRALMGGLNGQQIVLIQGPPGTGKTRTLLGLLSIILHAAPEGSIGVTPASKARNSSTRTEEDSVRLWRKANPWLSGITISRDTVKPWEEGSISDVFGLLNVAQPVRISKTYVPKAHVLVCAPSNSALDEIVIRLLINGIVDRTGKRYAPSIVRVGLKPHHLVQSVQLDTLTDKRIARLASDKGKQNVTLTERERIKLAVIEDAHIVCCTLSFAGSALLQGISRPFDVVVIDEAAQAVEPATLIPLCTGAKQVYLIGDPVQLPATVLSTDAVKKHYNVSLFKRLEMNNWPVIILDTQYRMHPEISSFPSTVFYHGNIKDGPGVLESTQRPWHAHQCLGPFAFFDVKGTEELTDDLSRVNTLEAELVMELFLALVTRYPELRGRSSSIAIISPYKAQVNLLKKNFRGGLGEMAKDVDINTIDGFQGREKDIAIFSAVRSVKGPDSTIGFVADERRVNVALTRARCSMLVVGNAMALENSDTAWSRLLSHARLRRKLWRARKPFPSFLDKAISGQIISEGPTRSDLLAEHEKQPRAERHVSRDEEEDDFSDSGPEDEQQHRQKRRNLPRTAAELAAAKKAKQK